MGLKCVYMPHEHKKCRVTRAMVGISTSNPYVFARKGLSQTPIDGCKAMRDVTEGCPGLQLPKAIRSTKLRKYLATTLQVSIYTIPIIKDFSFLYIYHYYECPGTGSST